MVEKNVTMAERAREKLELTVSQPICFQQICDLEKVKRHVVTLWKENKEVHTSLEKCRIYSLIMGKGKEWDIWWEANRFGIDIKSLKTFYARLQLRECWFCGNPYKKGRVDKKFCSDKCRNWYFQRRKKEEINAS